MSFVFFDSWIQYRAKLGFLPDINLVDRTQYKLILSEDDGIESDNTIESIVSAEIDDTAYQRIPVIWGSGDEGFYDPFNRTQTLEDQVLTVSGEVTFASVVLLADCPDTSPSVAIQSVSFTTDTITTASAHGRVSGDPIMLSFDDTYPAGTDPQTLYYADAPTTTVLVLLETPTGGVVDLTSNGAGSGFVRFASGIPVGFAIADSSTLVPANQSVPITLSLGANQT